MTVDGRAPMLVLAADHRARGVVTIESYADYLGAIAAALPACDGILASARPLSDLAASGAVEARHRTYLSINRTGLAGSVFELDDRLVASVERAAAIPSRHRRSSCSAASSKRPAPPGWPH
jgi:hypothetical protein